MWQHHPNFHMATTGWAVASFFREALAFQFVTVLVTPLVFPNREAERWFQYINHLSLLMLQHPLNCSY